MKKEFENKSYHGYFGQSEFTSIIGFQYYPIIGSSLFSMDRLIILVMMVVKKQYYSIVS